MRKVVIVILLLVFFLTSAFALNTQSRKEISGIKVIKDFGLETNTFGTGCDFAITPEGEYVLRLVSDNEYDNNYIVIKLGNSKNDAINNIKDLLYIIETKKDGELVDITSEHTVYRQERYTLPPFDSTPQKHIPRLVASQKGLSGKGYINQKQLQTCIEALE